MKFLAFLMFVLLAPAICLAQVPAVSAEASKLAAKIAAPQMTDMIRGAIIPTKTMGMIVKEKGKDWATKSMATEIPKVVKKYGPEWQNNLALSYDAFLSQPDLVDLNTGQPSQATMKKFMEFQPKIGAKMQGMSQDLLKKASVEVLSTMFKAAVPATQGKKP